MATSAFRGGGVSLIERQTSFQVRVFAKKVVHLDLKPGSIANRSTFCPHPVSHQVYFCHDYGRWSHFWSLSAKTHVNQPPKLFGSTSISIQSKQSFLSFHFPPHSSIRVIALIPGIERLCHSVSRSWWLKHHSGTRNFSWDIVHTSIVSPHHSRTVLFVCFAAYIKKQFLMTAVTTTKPLESNIFIKKNKLFNTASWGDFFFLSHSVALRSCRASFISSSFGSEVCSKASKGVLESVFSALVHRLCPPVLFCVPDFPRLHGGTWMCPLSFCVSACLMGRGQGLYRDHTHCISSKEAFALSLSSPSLSLGNLVSLAFPSGLPLKC